MTDHSHEAWEVFGLDSISEAAGSTRRGRLSIMCV
jgi:hypothetical protein